MIGGEQAYNPSTKWPSLHENNEYEGERIDVPNRRQMMSTMLGDIEGNKGWIDWMRQVLRNIQTIRNEPGEHGDVFDFLFDEGDDNRDVVKDANDMRQIRDLNVDDLIQKSDGSRTVREMFSRVNFDYFFKVWLQFEYERMIAGLRSPNILRGTSRSREERQTEDKLNELAAAFNPDLERMLDEGENDFLNHIKWTLLMCPWLDRRPGVRRLGAIGPRDISKIIVKSLLQDSRSKSKGSDREFWRRVYMRQRKDELVEWATENNLEGAGGIQNVVDELQNSEIAPRQEWLDDYFEGRSIPAISFVKNLRQNLEGTIKKFSAILEQYPTFFEGDGMTMEHSVIESIKIDEEDEELRAQLERVVQPEVEDYALHDIRGWLQGCGPETDDVERARVRRVVETHANEVVTRLFGAQGEINGTSLEEREGQLLEFFDIYVEYKKVGFGNTGGVSRFPRIWDEFSEEQKRWWRLDHHILRFSFNVLILLHSDLQWVYFDSGDFGDIDDHYSNVEEDDSASENWQRSPPNMLRFSRTFSQRFMVQDGGKEHAVFRTLHQEPRRWMYCQPEDHSSRWDSTPDLNVELAQNGEIQVPKVEPGGFLSTRNEDVEKFIGDLLGLVVLNNQIYDKLEELHNEFPHRTLPGSGCLKALNHLQKTQWEVNLDFLQAIAVASRNTNDGGSEKLLKPMREKTVHWNGMHFKEWLENARKRHDEKISLGLKRKWEKWDYTLNNARKAIGNVHNVFWHSWAVDYRGRLLPRTPDMSPQGDDLDRALIRFKEWKPLGEKGVYWFYIHICNLFAKRKWGEKDGYNWKNGDAADAKWPFEKRYQWTVDNRGTLREIAQDFEPHSPTHNPKVQFVQILGLNSPPRSGDEAFQRLAVVLELERIHSLEDDGEKLESITSGQPIYQDASNNGFQHAAALLRTRELADAVNIIKSPKDGEQDLYQSVADAALDKFNKGDSKFRKLLEDKKGIVGNWRSWRVVFDRSMVKIPTMVAAYGAKDLLKCFVGREGKGKPGFTKKPPYTVDGIENFPSKCKMNKKGSFGKPVRISEEVWGIPLCNAEFASKEEFVKHMNEEHPWKPKLHLESPFVRMIFDHGLIDSDYDDWDQSISEEGESFQTMNDLLFELASLLTQEIKSIIEDVTGRAYSKIGELGLIVIQEHAHTLDPKHGGLIWDTGVDGGRLKGMKIRNFDVKLNPKTKPSPYAYWGISTDDSSRILLPEIDAFFREKNINFGELPTSIEEDGKDVRVYKTRANRELRRCFENSNCEQEKNTIKQFLRRLVKRHTISSDDLTGYVSTDNGKEARRSVTPNFIHSLDAAHMRDVVCDLKERGVNDIWAVHDCFGTHACDVEQLRESVTNCFIEMHRDRTLGDWLVELHPRGFNIEKDVLGYAQRMIDEGTLGEGDDFPLKSLVQCGNEIVNGPTGVDREIFLATLPNELRENLEKEWGVIQKSVNDSSYKYGIEFAWIEYITLKRKISAMLWLQGAYKQTGVTKWKLVKYRDKNHPNYNLVMESEEAWKMGDWEKAIEKLLEVAPLKKLRGAFLGKEHGPQKMKGKPPKKIQTPTVAFCQIDFSQNHEDLSKLTIAQLEEKANENQWPAPEGKKKADWVEHLKGLEKRSWFSKLRKRFPEDRIELTPPSHRNIGIWNAEKGELEMLDMGGISEAEFIIS